MVLSLMLPLAAAANGESYQSFQIKGSPPTQGMLMSLAPGASDVTPATAATADSLVGVVTAGTGLNDQTNSVNIATSGVANALVSTQDGDIQVGDRITASAIQGVGSKLTQNGWIVGIAQQKLNAGSAAAIKSSVTTSKGAVQTVYVASIPVAVKVSYYSNAAAKSQTTNWVQRLAEAVVHKHVSTTALVLSFILFLLGLMAATAIITSSIRNAFLAISRQPLAKTVIVRAELRSLGIAVGVLVFTLLAAFFLLRIL